MIGIKGQWELRLQIEGLEDSDITSAKNFQSFKTIVEAGNIVPSFELVIDTHEKDIFRFINNKNLLITAISDGYYFGPSIEWVILTCTSTKSESKYRFTISGILNKVKYLTQHYIYITDEETSVDAIEEIASKSFNVVKDTASADVQNWIQPNITDRRFINDILKYSFKPDNFITTAIDEYGFFYIKDGLSLLDQPPIDILHYNGGEDGIPFLSDYELRNRTGIMSFWQGKETSKVVYKIEDGFQEQLDINFNSYNPNDECIESLGYRYNHNYIYNDNTHSNIQEAITRQNVGPAYFSGYQVRVDYALNQLDAVSIFNTIDFIDDELDSLRLVHAKRISGKYIIGKVVTTITSNEYSKSLSLYKPSLG